MLTFARPILVLACKLVRDSLFDCMLLFARSKAKQSKQLAMLAVSSMLMLVCTQPTDSLQLLQHTASFSLQTNSYTSNFNTLQQSVWWRNLSCLVLLIVIIIIILVTVFFAALAISNYSLKAHIYHQHNYLSRVSLRLCSFNSIPRKESVH